LIEGQQLLFLGHGGLLSNGISRDGINSPIAGKVANEPIIPAFNGCFNNVSMRHAGRVQAVGTIQEHRLSNFRGHAMAGEVPQVALVPDEVQGILHKKG